MFRSAWRLASWALCGMLAACGGSHGDDAPASSSSALTSSAVRLAPGEHLVRISWNAEPTAPVSGYRVFHGSTPAADSGQIEGGLATDVDFRTMARGRYYFSVVAIDVMGIESARSATVYVDL